MSEPRADVLKRWIAERFEHFPNVTLRLAREQIWEAWPGDEQLTDDQINFEIEFLSRFNRGTGGIAASGLHEPKTSLSKLVEFCDSIGVEVVVDPALHVVTLRKRSAA